MTMKADTITDYLIKETLGTGTFSKVKLGVHRKTEEKVAIKILDKAKIQDRDDIVRIQREIKIITSLNHPNVIHIKNFCDTKHFYFIIMEYCQGGELFNYIVNKSCLTEDEAAYFYYQLINGVEYIHSRGVVHRDLKPENLLLDQENRLKIIDFGLSNFFNSKLLSTPCGSPCYASPEMVSGLDYNGFCIDVWSTGIILFAMLCGYLPFEDESNEILFEKISQCNLALPLRITRDAGDLIRRILVANPERRITIRQIKEHRFYLKGREACLEIERQRKEKQMILNDIDGNCSYLPVQTDYSNKLNKKQKKSVSKKKAYQITTPTSEMNKDMSKKRPFSTEHGKYSSNDQIVHTCSSMTNTMIKDGFVTKAKMPQEWLKSIKTLKKKSNKAPMLLPSEYNPIQSKRIKTLASHRGIKQPLNKQKHIAFNSRKKSFSNLSTNSGSQKAAINLSPNPMSSQKSKTKRTQRKQSNHIQLKNHLIVSKINQCLTLSNLNQKKCDSDDTRSHSPKKMITASNRLASPANIAQLKLKHIRDKDLIQKQINYLLTEGLEAKKTEVDSKMVEYFACPTSSNKTNRYSVANAKAAQKTQLAHNPHTPHAVSTQGKIENLFFKSMVFKSPTYK